jgi:hypothetical protein
LATGVGYLFFRVLPYHVIQIPIPIGNSNSLSGHLNTISLGLPWMGALLGGATVYGFVIGFFQAANNDTHRENILPFLVITRSPNFRTYAFLGCMVFSIFMEIFFIYPPGKFFIELNMNDAGFIEIIIGVLIYLVMLFLGAAAITTLGGFVVLLVVILPITLVTLSVNWVSILLFEDWFIRRRFKKAQKRAEEENPKSI